ncbi:MAG: response regulator [Candidatus Tectomicrobia bacterium]|uniref:Response regulator n=1 Tax=Tectimicrobiota bacterium TaxID=2528274 RepID=A0A932MPQ0_UNCTE|nr:response regulator [Candidatus Tectomicrobia bacterium]
MERVLVADDEKGIVQFVGEALRRKGYSVHVASNGAEAFEMAKLHRPHLVLLDIRMPGMDGLEALRRIKSVDPIIRVIVITAVHDREIIDAAYSMGASRYMTKPFELDSLAEAMEEALKQ